MTQRLPLLLVFLAWAALALPTGRTGPMDTGKKTFGLTREIDSRDVSYGNGLGRGKVAPRGMNWMGTHFT